MSCLEGKVSGAKPLAFILAGDAEIDFLTNGSREHLYRNHMLPKHMCSRCLQQFDDDANLKKHQRRDPPCEVSKADLPEGITEEQETKLRTRESAGTSEEERWHKMCHTLFPGAGHTTPCKCDPFLLPLTTAETNSLRFRAKDYDEVLPAMPAVQSLVEPTNSHRTGSPAKITAPLVICEEDRKELGELVKTQVLRMFQAEMIKKIEEEFEAVQERVDAMVPEFIKNVEARLEHTFTFLGSSQPLSDEGGLPGEVQGEVLSGLPAVQTLEFSALDFPDYLPTLLGSTLFDENGISLEESLQCMQNSAMSSAYHDSAYESWSGTDSFCSHSRGERCERP
jgi:hypothetical protein